MHTVQLTRNQKVLLLALAAIVIGVTSYTFLAVVTQPEVKTETEQLFEPNPQFEPYKDLLGNEVALTDYLDKVIVVHSWASWCPSCVSQLQLFADSTVNTAENVQIIAINRAEPATTIERFKTTFGIDDRVLMVLDPSDRFYSSVGAYAMPETIIYDQAGNKALHIHGEITKEQLEETIRQLLEEN